ncbi:MAG TPA: N-6 DNA methylase [Pyrinomonadaceae bacterium]|jgi:type I restriction-modification system DNA methylase subunit
MVAEFNSIWEEQLNLKGRRPPEFFRSLEEIESAVPTPPQAHAMRRAWVDMSLSGIFCIDNVPVAYIKDVNRVEQRRLRKLHRKLWNQGIAPILIVISPTDVLIFSGLTPPAKDAEDINQENRLVQTLNRSADALELLQLIQSIEAGEFFERNAPSFNPKLRVDRYLLRNLDDARGKLGEKTSEGNKLNPQTVHALLGRIVFTCYLIDREIINESYFAEIGAEGTRRISDLLESYSPTKAKKLLYTLFQRLQVHFNGDIFDGDLEAESKLIQPEHIEILKRFLTGEDLESGQMALGFWAYDFSVIPIETISAIYERFLNAEDPSGKRESGAYYTPRFLAEVVLDMVLAGVPTLLDKRFLDPACGSGIFLVGIFNRLAEEWRRSNVGARNGKRFAALKEILTQNLFGVDRNETACRIAAFSLYLAFLDQLEPRDIQQLQLRGNILPKLVAYRGEPVDPEAGNNILCRDFFEENLPLPFEEDSTIPTEAFDIIIGNPPWARSSRRQSKLEKWCKDAGLEIPQKQLAYGFVFKAPNHLKDNGRVCFLLPAGVLFNHQSKAQKVQREWITTHAVEQILNLSDMCFYLFDDAIRPAIVVEYEKAAPQKSDYYIDYLTPKTEAKTLKAEILTVSPEDRVEISVNELLFNKQWADLSAVWKQYFWGTPRDRELLSRLALFPPLSNLAGHIKDQKRWTVAQGFQPEGPNDDPAKSKDRPWPDDELFLEARSKNIELVLLESDCSRIRDRFKRLRRLPEAKDIFLAPHVIVTQGLRAAFADFDVVFRHAIQGIHGPTEDDELLMFLTAYLDSSLAQYFLFHTSANWGIERDKVHESELLRLPFPLPKDTGDPSGAKRIVREVASLMRGLKVKIREGLFIPSTIEQTRREILPHIYGYFNVDEFEQILIEDTVNISIPSSTPARGSQRIPTLEKSSPEQRQAYLELLSRTLNEWAQRSQYEIFGKVILATHAGTGVVVLERTSKSGQRQNYSEQTSLTALNQTLQRMFSIIAGRQGSINFLQNLKVFDVNKLYICKPLTRRFWTGTSALNDADEIAAAILTESHGKQYEKLRAN